MRAEQEEREKKVFGAGKNWKPNTTLPKAPKLSKTPVRGERNFRNEVKSLSKPVASYHKNQLGQEQQDRLLEELGMGNNNIPNQ